MAQGLEPKSAFPCSFLASATTLPLSHPLHKALMQPRTGRGTLLEAALRERFCKSWGRKLQPEQSLEDKGAPPLVGLQAFCSSFSFPSLSRKAAQGPWPGRDSPPFPLAARLGSQACLSQERLAVCDTGQQGALSS